MIPNVQQLLDLSQTSHAQLFDGCTYAWQVLPRIPAYVAEATANPEQSHSCIGTPYIQTNVVIGEGTIVEHGAVIKGPAIIGRNCRIGPGAYIRENVIIGDNCVVGNSVELKHCLLFNGCQVPHYNYIGESVLGYKAHLGAGAICSNWKLIPTAHVFVTDGETKLDSGLLKLGAVLGDRAEVGCNAVLNPGSVIGRDSVVYPTLTWRGVLAERTIAKTKADVTLVPRTIDNSA